MLQRRVPCVACLCVNELVGVVCLLIVSVSVSGTHGERGKRAVL